MAFQDSNGFSLDSDGVSWGGFTYGWGGEEDVEVFEGDEIVLEEPGVLGDLGTSTNLWLLAAAGGILYLFMRKK